MQQHFGTTFLLTAALGGLSGLGIAGFLAIDSWIFTIGMVSAAISLILLKVYTLPLVVEPLLRASGYVLGTVGLYAFFSPTLADTRETYISVTSVIVLVESSIVLLLHGNAQRQVYNFGIMPLAFYQGILHARPQVTTSSK